MSLLFRFFDTECIIIFIINCFSGILIILINQADDVVDDVGTLVLEAKLVMGKDILGNNPGNPGGKGPPIRDGGMPPNMGLESMGDEANRIRSNSDSCNRFDLARRFWNQILTWVSVNFKDAENSARSAMDKYCF